MTPDARKKVLARASRAARELAREQATYGSVSDGAGRRYRVGVHFLQAGALEKAGNAFDWYEQTFPDDAGEPVFLLYAALTAYRLGQMDKATTWLLRSLLSNVYLLPWLAGQAPQPLPLWHASNWQQLDYLQEVAEFLHEHTADERQWIASALDSAPFKAMHEGHVATYRALDGLSDIRQRAAVLERWEQLQARYLPGRA